MSDPFPLKPTGEEKKDKKILQQMEDSGLGNAGPSLNGHMWDFFGEPGTTTKRIGPRPHERSWGRDLAAGVRGEGSWSPIFLSHRE